MPGQPDSGTEERPRPESIVSIGEHRLALDQLAQQARLFEATLSAISDFAYSFDRNGRFTYVNKSLLDLWGLQLEQAIGKNFFDLGYPDPLAAKLQRQIQLVFETQCRLSDETAYTSPTGKGGYYEYIFVPVFGIDGTIEAVAGSTRDITARKQGELEREQLLKQVQIERERLAEAFARSPAFVAVMRGPDHVFEFVNDRYRQLIGKRDVVGRTVREAVPEVQGQGFFEILDRVYTTGESFVGTGMRIMLRHQPHGPLEEKHLDFVYQPMRGADGAVVGIMAHGIDVTHRMRVEAALVESQRRLQPLFEHTQDAILLADDNARYVDANPAACELTGYSRDELLRLGVWDISPLDNQAQARQLWQDFIGKGKQGGEYSIFRKDGSKVEVEYRAVANLLPGLHLSVLRDVTDRKRTEAALRESHQALEAANKAKDQFLAILSHELRTPLSPVVMSLAAMELQPQLPEKLRQDVAMIRRNVDLETKLIDDLLDMSRITSGKLRLQLQPISLHEVLRHAMEVCVSDINAKQLRMEVDLAANTHQILGDPTRLEQVFWNLLKNAIKFSGENGTITVKSANPDPSGVVVEVIDHGVGIPHDVLPRVFDAFEQGDARMTRQFGGLGLGLAISKAVIDMHGGSIRAISGGAGTGATFIVQMQTTGNPVGRSAAPKPVDASPVAGTCARILLVEDHQDTAMVMARLLKSYGYVIKVAHSVAAALQAAADERFDLVVSDIGLPDASGYELMRQIKDRHGIQGIALTGFGMEDDMRRGREAGFADHVVKPVNVSHLEAVIRRVLAGNDSR